MKATGRYTPGQVMIVHGSDTLMRQFQYVRLAPMTWHACTILIAELDVDVLTNLAVKGLSEDQ